MPRRLKWKASSFSAVPTVTPRNRWERSFTQSKKWLTPSVSRRDSLKFCSSSQVELSTSHISEVMAPRTARAFSRAAFAQEKMLDGLPASSTM